MADNVTANAGSGGSVFAADDISSVFYPRSKIVIGADGTNDGDVCATNPMPVVDAATKLEDAAHSSGDRGMYILSVRADSPAASGGTDGDYQNILTDANGCLWSICKQSGTWNITNISGTITLPTGAATAAKQPALGTAGTASADVLTIQGISSMTPLLSAQSGTWNIGTVTTITNVVHVDDNSGSLTVDNGGTFAVQAAQSGTWNIGTVTTVSTITNVVHVDDNSGSLTVDAPVGTPVFVRLSDGSAAITTLAVSLASVPSHAVTNAGAFAVQESGGALTSLQLIDDTVFADDAAFTVATSKVIAAGFMADETATDSVDEGDIGIARMTLDRKQQVVSESEGDTIRIAGVAYTVKRVNIAAASSGDNTIVAAVSSKKIRVIAMNFICAAAVSLYFKNTTTGAIWAGSTNKAAFPANGGIVLPENKYGWFQTGTNNEDLILNLSGAIAVGGSLNYIEI